MSKRISFEEGVELFKNASLEELKERAHSMRMQKNPRNEVTFILDSNPNYTNVCQVDCTFCAFYRHKGVKDAYTKTVDEVMKDIERASKAGCKAVLLQGGVHPDLKLDYYVDLVRTCRSRYPNIQPHFFSAVEIWNCAKVSGVSIREVLEALWDAGQRTLPGGGAEILSENVRKVVSPKKIYEDGWIEVHQTAHKIGYRTTATMMYGHVEEPEDVLTHLEALRQAQDEIPGFTAFIPWSYKRDRTALRRKVKHWAGRDAYLRIIAFSRLYLDNFDHIQGSWFGEGREIGMESLRCGADDFGSLLLDENVHAATGFINHTDLNEILSMIREVGFVPVERNYLYERLKSYEDIEKVEIPEEQKVRTENRTDILYSTCK